MSLHTNFHAPRTTLSWRIQIGHKSGFIIIIIYLFIISSLNIKPPRHRFGLSLCLGLAIESKCVDKLAVVALNNSSLTGVGQLLVVTNVIVGFLFFMVQVNVILVHPSHSLVRTAGVFGKSIHPDCLLPLFKTSSLGASFNYLTSNGPLKQIQFYSHAIYLENIYSEGGYGI